MRFCPEREFFLPGKNLSFGRRKRRFLQEQGIQGSCAGGMDRFEENYRVLTMSHGNEHGSR